jgi:hypothetical protein
MNRFIANSTAAAPLGIPTGRKCLEVKSGLYAGRLAILYASSASNIMLTWSDPPYLSFSSPISIVTDAGDYPFSAFMSDAGDIYLAYTLAAGNNLGFVKIAFSEGNWSAGTPVTVYDGDDNYYPSIGKMKTGYLWIGYTRVSGGTRYISAKVSTDDGATWGTVSSPGDTLTTGASSAYAVMVEAGDYQYVFYSEGAAKIAYRRKLTAGAVWNSEVILASGSGYSEHLAAAVDVDGKIGLAYASSAGLKFREYSGASWSGEFTIEDIEAAWPQVSYHGGMPYVVYSRAYGTGMDLIVYARKETTAFSAPQPLDGRKSYFQQLLVYDASAGTYQDKSEEASSPDTADIKHSTSGALLAAKDDAVYFGMEEPFASLRLVLSTAGTGGEVAWKYWDGQSWKSFDPASGPWHFTTTEQGLLLWTDYSSIPADWQKKAIAGGTRYWVAAVVTTAFTTAPIGTQVTSMSPLDGLAGQG